MEVDLDEGDVDTVDDVPTTEKVLEEGETLDDDKDDEPGEPPGEVALVEL